MSAGPEQTGSSVAEWLAILQVHNPQVAALLSSTTEEAFTAASESAIERAITTIEANAKIYSAHDERGLSQLLVDFLNVMGFSATSERNHNGHVDVTVEHLLKRWQYLGECKIHRGFQYHVDVTSPRLE